MTEFIGDALYCTIKDVMPIFCVDLVVLRGNAALLCRRLNEPAKDEWWLPGGRLLKNEEILEAVSRLSNMELGIDVMIIREVGFYNLILVNAHTPNITVLTQLLDPKCKITLDSQHSEYRFVGKDEIASMKLNPHLIRVLDDSKIFRGQL